MNTRHLPFAPRTNIAFHIPITIHKRPASAIASKRATRTMSSAAERPPRAKREMPPITLHRTPFPSPTVTQSFGQSTSAKQLTSSNNTNTTSSTSIQLLESIRDIFTAPPNTLIIHACNTEGSWGAGIAQAFKHKYPAAFEVYRSHCQLNGRELVAQALLIPPQDDAGEQHFVGCLFTSRSKGRKVDSPAKILNATAPAMRHLLRQVGEYNACHRDRQVGEVRMCKINSGLFNVPWEKTKEVIQAIPVEADAIRQIQVISRCEAD